jgi:hypothetical protein
MICLERYSVAFASGNRGGVSRETFSLGRFLSLVFFMYDARL